MVKKYKNPAGEMFINKSFLRDLVEKGNAYVAVGYLDDPDNRVEAKGDATKTTLNSQGEVRDTGYSVGEVAYILHEGWAPSNIPPRPFIRDALEKNDKKLTELFRRLIKKEMRAKKFNINRVLGPVGRRAVSYIKRQIRINDYPELQDPTRGGRFPAGDAILLRDTDELYNSVGYQKVVEP